MNVAQPDIAVALLLPLSAAVMTALLIVALALGPENKPQEK
jgi:hypothetical protein